LFLFFFFLPSHTHTHSEDDDEVATFFPVHKKSKKHRTTTRKQQKHKDVDTFSIQEMTIIESDFSDGNDGDKSSDDEEDEDDCDSQLNLELPPRTNQSVIDKIKQLLCCARASQSGMF